MYILLIILIILVFILFDPLYKKFIENFETTEEAIKNIASLYNTLKMDIMEANITGIATIGGTISISDNTTIGGNLSVAGNVGSGLTKSTLVDIHSTRRSSWSMELV